MFAALGMDAAEQQHKFGFLLGAFEYGAPPHGGIAFGFDRLCAILGGSESIRDFIAFPKNNAGRDVMLDAPATIDEKQFEELQIKLNLKIKKQAVALNGLILYLHSAASPAPIPYSLVQQAGLMHLIPPQVHPMIENSFWKFFRPGLRQKNYSVALRLLLNICRAILPVRKQVLHQVDIMSAGQLLQFAG